MQVLRAFWLELRAKAPGCEGGTVTLRQLESLVRLAEARARCDLRSSVTEVCIQHIIQGASGRHLENFAFQCIQTLQQ